jgi:hypothetical protein
MKNHEAHEFENHFMIKDAEGKSFPVAKEGLKPEVIDRIRGLAPKKMASGGVVPGLDEISSEMPNAPSKMEDPTIGIPTATPQQLMVENQKDMLQKLQPGLYASAPPDLLDRDAQNMTLNRVERDMNSKHAESFFNAEKDAKRSAEDQAYNERAQKLGLPVRPISAPAGESNMTPALATADGHMMPDKAPVMPQPDLVGGYGKAFGTAESAIGDMAKASQQYGQEAGSAMKEQMEKSQKLDQHFEAVQAEFHKKDAELTDQLMTGKIDPNRVWNDMSTGNKVTAAIAIALGGIGSGLTGKSNAALDVINGAIDRDIMSQKENMGKTQTLLAQNLQKYRTQADAYNMTKAQLMSAAQAKITLAATKMGTTQAMSQAKIQVADIQLKKVALMTEVAKSQALQLLKQGDINPAIAQMLPKEDRERYIPGEGFALTSEGAKELRKLKADKDTSFQGIDRLIEIRNKYGRQALPGEIKAEAQTIAGTLQGRLRTFLVGPGAVSDSERKILERIVNSDPTSISTLDATILGSLKTLKNAVGNGYENALIGEGVKQGSKTFQRQQ